MFSLGIAIFFFFLSPTVYQHKKVEKHHPKVSGLHLFFFRSGIDQPTPIWLPWSGSPDSKIQLHTVELRGCFYKRTHTV